MEEDNFLTISGRVSKSFNNIISKSRGGSLKEEYKSNIISIDNNNTNRE